jgi:hypothetical protein
MGVQIRDLESGNPSDTGEYLAIHTSQAPFDATITLVTIERVIERTVKKGPSDSPWRIKTLVHEKPMSPDAALGFATCYAERKHIPVVYTASK